VHTPAPSGSELLASGIQIVARNGETSFSPRLSNLALCYYGLHNNTDKTEYWVNMRISYQTLVPNTVHIDWYGMHEIRQNFYMKKHRFQDDGKKQTLAYWEDWDNTEHKIMLIKMF
jgi:hypothetical protein